MSVAKEIMDTVAEFIAYLKDFNSHGGGFMRDKYGDDPMKGSLEIERHAKRMADKVASLLKQEAV